VSVLDRLYDEVVKRHSNQPYHFEKREQSSLQAYNSICGDRFDLFIDMKDGRINAFHFHGYGCAVSKASTSVLVGILEGKSIMEAKEITNQFLRLLKNEVHVNETLFSEEFKSFAVVQEVPARYDCAALAWKEVEKFLAGLKS
jgi:nitrogen fixation NifU-like protein